MRLKNNFLAPLLLVATAQGQTAPSPADQSTATFQSSSSAVLVDIVVTDSHREPVTGLKKSDFHVFEDGKLQNVTSLDEHKGGEIKAAAVASQPAGVVTNSPTVISADSVDVLLIDGLNTSALDQTFLHSQILKYLRTIPAGARVAVFTLTTRLRMLQEFTTDSSALLAAVNSNATFSSPLNQSEAEQQSQQQTINFMEANRAGPPPDDVNGKALDPVDVLQQVFAETTVQLSQARVQITLQALEDMARYLAPFPGRKNVLWVSGSFPVVFLPSSDLPDPFMSLASFQTEIAQTANLLTNARVAIYPIATQGLSGSSTYQANGTEISQVRIRPDRMSDQLNQEAVETQSVHQSMEELAKDTGGQAFYNTNGIGEALARVTNSSANFYTLSYTPTNKKMDGKYRHISVKLATEKEKLSYRRGYFALSGRDSDQKQETDPLVSVLTYGMPDISQIVYKASVASVSRQSGDSRNGPVGGIKDPGAIYNLDLEIFPDQLQFETTPDGIHHGKIELKLVGYDATGKVLNVVGGSFGLTFKPDRFEKMRRDGIQFREQIAIPISGHVRFYSGIFDLNSGRIGTLSLTSGGQKPPAVK